MKHVTVGRAIDWQQWQLDQSVRSIRMQVDKEGDLYALPVVVIDPTGEKVSASPSRTTTVYDDLITSGITDLWIPPDDQDAYVQGFVIDYGNLTSVAPLAATIRFRDRQDAPIAWYGHYAWIADVAVFRPSLVVQFPDTGIRSINGVAVYLTAGCNGFISVQMWGYEA